jgi:hypothetical protein
MVIGVQVLYSKVVNMFPSIIWNVALCVSRHAITARIFEVMLANRGETANMATSRNFEVMSGRTSVKYLWSAHVCLET